MIKAVIATAKKNSLVRFVQRKFPMLFLYLVIKPLNLFRFKNEKELLNGRSKPSSEKPSIILYTTHKCASTYTTKLLETLTSLDDFVSVDLEAYLAMHNEDILKFPRDKPKKLQRTNQPRGFYFGPMRYFFPFPDQANFKKVLVLRDPRDVLTSYYYSKLYSHIVINEQFAQEREYYKNHSIDEFVLEMCEDIKSRYQNYISNLPPEDNLLINSYEKMVTNFDAWLDDLENFLEITIPENLKTEIKNSRAKKGSSDKGQHIRNIMPGDHKNKLKPETIALLNQELKEVLIAFNYV